MLLRCDPSLSDIGLRSRRARAEPPPAPVPAPFDAERDERNRSDRLTSDGRTCGVVHRLRFDSIGQQKSSTRVTAAIGVFRISDAGVDDQIGLAAFAIALVRRQFVRLGDVTAITRRSMFRWFAVRRRSAAVRTIFHR